MTCKEAPILFNQAMMPLVLDGSKTQTRRPIKVPPGGSARAIFGECNELLGARTYDASGKEYGWQKPIARHSERLWARETWTSAYARGCWGTLFHAGKAFVQGARQHAHGPHFNAEDLPPYVKWRPSIHMPRWAARALLPLVSVRVEFVSDISEADARAEGFFDKLAFELAWRDIYGTAEWCFVYEWSKAVIA